MANKLEGMDSDSICHVCKQTITINTRIKEHEFIKPCTVELEKLNNSKLKSVVPASRRKNRPTGAGGGKRLATKVGNNRRPTGIPGIVVMRKNRRYQLVQGSPNSNFVNSFYIKLRVNEGNMENEKKLRKEYLKSIYGKRFFECTVKLRKCKLVDKLLLKTKVPGRKVSFNSVVEVI